jgi:hypothetical protein
MQNLVFCWHEALCVLNSNADTSVQKLFIQFMKFVCMALKMEYGVK